MYFIKFKINKSKLISKKSVEISYLIKIQKMILLFRLMALIFKIKVINKTNKIN